jgi:hypothetical protein
VILHTIAKVRNLGEVALKIKGIQIRAHRILPPPLEIAAKVREGDDPVDSGQSEVNWTLAAEARECDWSNEPHVVEPGETEEIPLDLVIPSTVDAVEVYTYIQNVTQSRTIGWQTNTIYALNSKAFKIAQRVSEVPAVGTPLIPERLEIVNTTKQQPDKGFAKQQGPKPPSTTHDQAVDKGRQAPAKPPSPAPKAGEKK